MSKVKEYILKAFETENLEKQEIIEILKSEDKTEIEFLFKKADEKKREFFSNKVFLRGIVEFSSYCRCLCSYCGLNANNKCLKRYRMTEDEILDAVKKIAETEIDTVVLQSGEDLWYDKDKIINIIKRIKQETNLKITLSIGERSKTEYKAFKEAGADRFLLKHEIADESLYNKYHKHSTFKKRIDCIKTLKKLGYETGSGFMVGIYGDNFENMAENIILLKKLNVDMAGIGTYINSSNTELEGKCDGDSLLTLKCVAITRLLIPKCNLPSTTSLNILGGLNDALLGGANVVMLKATPFKYINDYKIYNNNYIEDIGVLGRLNILKEKLAQMNLTIV